MTNHENIHLFLRAIAGLVKHVAQQESVLPDLPGIAGILQYAINVLHDSSAIVCAPGPARRPIVAAQEGQQEQPIRNGKTVVLLP